MQTNEANSGLSENLGLVQLVTHLSHVVVSHSSMSFHFSELGGGNPVFSIDLKAVLVLFYLVQLIPGVPPSPKGSQDKPPPAQPHKVNAVRRLKDGKGFALIIEPDMILHALYRYKQEI